MNDNPILEKSITTLEIDTNVEKVLLENNIDTVQKLWPLKRADLRNLGLSDHQIHQIIIKLQLHGLDLNKKVTN